MKAIDEDFGELNPEAPAALSHFSFLVGRWNCEAKLKISNENWQAFHAVWRGRFILDGYAIADEYTMTDLTGALVVLGMNVRTYDAIKEAWNIRWLNALEGTWTDLASPEASEVRIDKQSIIYFFKEPVAAHAYTRATYKNISAEHFTWLGEKSDDANTWTEFMVVECHRAQA